MATSSKAGCVSNDFVFSKEWIQCYKEKEKRGGFGRKEASFLPWLYTDTMFPVINTHDLQLNVSGADNRNGSCKMLEGGQSVCDIQWTGYASQIYDGQLLFYCLDSDSTIFGECLGEPILFQGHELKNGKWPGFLVMYRERKENAIV